MAKVVLSHVNKTYKGNVQAVSDVSLTIEDGEFLVIIGPSGCGKTTLLRMVAGLDEVNSGEVCIGDRPVNDIPPKDRNIAMVSQTYSLYPQMTVYKNIAFGLEMKKMSPDEIDLQVHRAAKLLELESILGRKPKTLSGGQLQRVALGRAIVRDPDVFLLDEPLSNLDATFRTNMRLQINRLHRKLGTTFIYVTHDQTEAMTMADRIVVMKDGRIQQVDTPKNIYQKPANAFVASFFGQPQMKFADALLQKSENGWELSLSKITIPLPVKPEDETKLLPYQDKKLLIGLRPEAICPDPDFFREHPECRFFGNVIDTTPVGSDVYITIDCTDTILTSRADSSCPLHSGVMAEFAIDISQVYLFDPETQETIYPV